MSEACSLTWAADVERLAALGGLNGSWKTYTPSIVQVSVILARHAPSYLYIARQFLSLVQIDEIVTAADPIGNAVISAGQSGIEASVTTLRDIAYACLALSSGARSFVEIGSGYGSFAFILDRVAAALDYTITSFTLCDIAAAQPVQAAYLANVKIQNVNYISIENNGTDFKTSADLMYSAYTLSELPNKLQLIENILPHCNMLFWAWSSPDRTGIPLNATSASEYPPTAKANLFVTRGFNLSLQL
jgi:hypothetical protein